MISKTVFHILVIISVIKGDSLPDSIRELQQYFGDGTSNDVTNVFYKVLQDEQGLPSQAAESLKQHLTSSEWYGFDDDHLQKFVDNMKLISETKIENEENLKDLKSKLHEPDDFQTALLMDVLLDSRDDSEEASAGFDKAFITLDNSMVQLYYTSDDDIFSGVVVAGKLKHTSHAVYLAFLVD